MYQRREYSGLEIGAMKRWGLGRKYVQYKANIIKRAGQSKYDGDYLNVQVGKRQRGADKKR